MNEDAFEAALRVLEVLHDIRVPAFVGGSLASTVFGTPRSTIDADLIAHLRSVHVKPFIKNLGADFYSDEQAILSAINHQGCFNVIHLESMMKVDVFIAKDRAFDRHQLKRVVRKSIRPDSDQSIPFASPEDVILAKLEWYRMGEEISERQWLDVLGIFKVMSQDLDYTHLSEWGKQLGISDLLEKAISDSK